MMWTWLALQLALASVCALMAGQSSFRRGITALLLAVIIAVPFMASPEPLKTVALCFVSIVAMLKSTQIGAFRCRWSSGRRMWHLWGVVDTRRARRVPPSLDVRTLGVVPVNGLLLIGAMAVLTGLGGLSGFARSIAWVMSTAVLAYASLEVLSGLLHVGYRACGVDAPAIQRNPIVSRSLAEFWGQRWNTVVSGWLREFMFGALARKKYPRLGLAAAFGASAALHAWLIVGLGIGAAAMIASYFALQWTALLVESRMRLRRAGPVLSRLWTMGVLLVPLPLLFGPWVQALGSAYFGAS